MRNPPLILLFAIAAVFGAFTPFLPAEGDAGRAAGLVAAIPLQICVVWWCQTDAARREQSFPKWLIWLIVLTGPIGLCLYFFRSRRPGSALIGIVLAILFLVLMLAVAVAAALLSAWIVCQTDSLVRYCPLEPG